MSELEQLRKLLVNLNTEPARAAVLSVRIAALEAVLNGQYRVVPPAPKP